MDTLEALVKRIATTQDLRSIVRTMKSLSAVSIRQYDNAVVALREYSRSVDLGFQVMIGRHQLPIPDLKPPEGSTIAVVVGSDYGLCGRFNQEIANFSRRELTRRGIAREDVVYLVAGSRASVQLAAMGERVEESFPLPGSVDGLTGTAHDILLKIDQWRAERRIGGVLIFHNIRSEMGVASPRAIQLLPLDRRWMQDLAERRWPSRAIPTFTMKAHELFASLVRQHLFIGLFKAGAESAASEHAARIAAMQAAERNIEEHLEEMNAAYRHKRQESITEELLDVVAGFEVLTTEDHL